MTEVELIEGMFVQLIGHATPDGYRPNFYKIISREPFEYTYTFSAAVASGAESSFQTINDLEPDSLPFHMYFVLWGIKDGCEYQIKIPTGTDRFGVDDDGDVARITNLNSPFYAPNPRFGFFLIHDLYPAINAINNTLASITPQAFFIGFKYDLELVTDDETLKRLNKFALRESTYIPSKKITLGGIS